MEIAKILWPTDFSSNAGAALDFVQSLAEKHHAEVHVLYVIEDMGGHAPWYGEFQAGHAQDIRQWEEKKARERLDEICARHLAGCPLFVKHVAVGDPATEILKLAEKEKVSLVVMSTSGSRGAFA